jgi:hypothetical protein
MDVDFSNTDSLSNTGSINPASAGMGFAEQPNPFANPDTRPINWDLGNFTFGVK